MIRACLILLVVGCATTDDGPPTFYTLRAPTQVERIEPKHDVEVIVRHLDIVDLYSRPKVVYRTGPHAHRVHDKREWVSPPAKMMRAMLAERLERSGVARSVVQHVGNDLPHYELTGRVEAIEEVRGEPPSARVAVTLRLICLRTEQVVWQQRFDTERQVPADQVPPDAIGRIFAEQVDEAARLISHALDAESGVQ